MGALLTIGTVSAAEMSALLAQASAFNRHTDYSGTRIRHELRFGARVKHYEEEVDGSYSVTLDTLDPVLLPTLRCIAEGQDVSLENVNMGAAGYWAADLFDGAAVTERLPFLYESRSNFGVGAVLTFDEDAYEDYLC